MIDANEGSHIFSDEIIKQEKLTTKAQEAGRIKLEIDTEQLDVTVVTGGDVNLKGTPRIKILNQIQEVFIRVKDWKRNIPMFLLIQEV